MLVTAFRSGKDLTLHVSNSKWERPITITGLPLELKEIQGIRTAEGDYFKKLGPLPANSGKVTLTLPAESLTTLTTRQIDGP